MLRKVAELWDRRAARTGSRSYSRPLGPIGLARAGAAAAGATAIAAAAPILTQKLERLFHRFGGFERIERIKKRWLR